MNCCCGACDERFDDYEDAWKRVGRMQFRREALSASMFLGSLGGALAFGKRWELAVPLCGVGLASWCHLMMIVSAHTLQMPAFFQPGTKNFALRYDPPRADLTKCPCPHYTVSGGWWSVQAAAR